jgi:hypothetical protein
MTYCENVVASFKIACVKYPVITYWDQQTFSFLSRFECSMQAVSFPSVPQCSDLFSNGTSRLSFIRPEVNSTFGRAIAQAVRRWLPTAAARVQTRVWSCGICCGQSGAGTGFLWVLRFPQPIFIPPISPQSLPPITWGWYNRPVVAAVRKVPPH